MGYTHYWYRDREIPEAAFSAVAKDFRKLACLLPEAGVALAGWAGNGRPEITEKCIRFNGRADRDEDCETFDFPRVEEKPKWQPEYAEGDVFCFCKSRREPYDLAVTAALIIAKRHLGKSIAVHSDGESRDWQDARRLCQAVLGYGADFALDRSEEE